MIVADTGPSIAFARLERLPLLCEVVDVLLIPDAVYEEVVERGQGRPGATEVAQATWIQRWTITDHTPMAQLPSVLHRVEREARHRSWDRPLYAFRGGLRGVGASSTESKIAANIERDF